MVCGRGARRGNSKALFFDRFRPDRRVDLIFREDVFEDRSPPFSTSSIVLAKTNVTPRNKCLGISSISFSLR